MNDARKHLETIQAVISCLANNTFVLKGWAVALFGFAGKQQESFLTLLTLFFGLVFWSFGVYDLAFEGRQRQLHVGCV